MREKEVTLTSDFKSKEVALKEKLADFNPDSASSLVPSFTETYVDGSFRSYEKIERKNNMPEDQWVSVLVPKLSCKAQRVYNSLDQPDDYDNVKQNTLNSYAIILDGYRQKFRKQTFSHTFLEFG